MASKSLTDIAYDRLKRKRKEILFTKLWTETAEEAGLPEAAVKKKITSFYNALMMDSRFISLEGNKWDLRERHSLDTLQIDPDLLDSYDDYEEEIEDYEIELSIEDDN